MIIDYYIIDPTGNITALVQNEVSRPKQKKIAAYIMKKRPRVEQVGFVDLSGDRPTLRMAGGEFCGNATVSTAALFCKSRGLESASLSISVDGTPQPVRVDISGRDYHYRGVIELSKPLSVETESFSVGEKGFSFPIAVFPGIAHIIADKSMSVETAQTLLRTYSRKFGYSAMGVMIYDRENDSLTPVVYVTECDTMFLENSCVSGCCAIAAYLSLREDVFERVISQPGGTLTVTASKDAPSVRISGGAVIEKHIKEEIDYE